MCGRFTHMYTWAELHRLLSLSSPPPDEDLPKRYNVAPTQRAPVVRATADGGREAALLRWGLVPSWAEDAKIAARLIHAGSETAAEKPAFRSAMRKRRCLVPASGFFEWQRTTTPKQPWRFRRRDGSPFAMAGLWEHWRTAKREALETFAILTTSANELVRPLHDRMPVILTADDWEAWLDPNHPDPVALQAMLRPCAPDAMEGYAVSTAVNRVSNDGPECVEPLRA